MKYTHLSDLPLDAFRPCGARMALHGGGGGGSTSANETTTQNIDKRLAVQDGIGISSDQSTVNVTALDGGVLAGAQATVQQAIELSKTGASNQLQGYESLLGLSGKVLDRLFDANKENQMLVSQTIDAVTPLTSAGGQSLVNGEQLKFAALIVGGVFAIKMIVK